MQRSAESAVKFLAGPVEAIRLRFFEVAFVASFALYFFVARFRYWREWLTPEGYHYPRGATPSYLIEPFDLLVPWAALLLGFVTAAAVLLVLTAKLRRPALIILFCVAVYIQNADALSAFALNIHYVTGFLLLSLSPHRTIHAGRTGAGEKLIASAWSLRVFQATILIQFFTAGWCKLLSQDWVKAGDVLWSHIQGPYRNHLAAWMLQTLPMSAWAAMQWSAFAFELVGPFLLIFRPTRWIGIVWGCGFVLFIALTMNDLLYFTVQLSCYLLLFLSASELRWLAERKPLSRQQPKGG